MIEKELQNIIKIALDEDCALNDVTSDLTILSDYNISFALSCREDIILCGVEACKICFELLKKSEKFRNSTIDLDILTKDGDFIERGHPILKGFGNAKLIFAAERVILNIIQHLSGVATITKEFTEALNNPEIAILDTRKTTLGLRNLEKYAVLMGGGKNHRQNLSDMVLIKDNHIAACQDIADAISRAKKSDKIVEVECDNLNQVNEALSAGPDIIMLDNMDPENVRKACEAISGRCKIEVSGGVNLGNIASYRDLEIDFISIGALTHSSRSVDIGLDVFNEKM